MASTLSLLRHTDFLRIEIWSCIDQNVTELRLKDPCKIKSMDAFSDERECIWFLRRTAVDEGAVTYLRDGFG